MSLDGLERRSGLYGFEFLEPDKRRAPDGQRKTYEIKQLWQRTHEIVNLAARGLKNTEIAEIMNVEPQTVSNTLNSELGQRKLADIRKSRDEEARVTHEKIRVLTNKALKTYHEIFDDESGECNLNDKKKVADTVLLELSGLRAPTRIQSMSASYTLTKEELEEFKQRGLKAAREAGLIAEEPKKVTEIEDFHVAENIDDVKEVIDDSVD
jgi:predicted transcriptional regulator